VQLEAVLRLCHLVSPAVPVGAYAYSQGLEYAVQAGWVTDESSALEWLQGLSRHSLATLELPLLMRLHRAWSDGDDNAVQHWNAQLLARRETAELRAEELHLGRSLAKVLCEFDMDAAYVWRDASPSLAAMFALAAVNWKIPAIESAGGYLWMWSENQVLAGVKLIPLGQSAGQRLLHALIAEMPALVESAASVADDDMSTGAISLGLASALHETQYTRLFRS
jgi:urease accessory protein